LGPEKGAEAGLLERFGVGSVGHGIASYFFGKNEC